MGSDSKLKSYRVNQKILSRKLGKVYQVGDIITRQDLPAASDEKFNHLVNDEWLIEVKDNG